MRTDQVDALLVSIIMPAYCTSATISESICSVLAQTYEKWELIIIDDASEDNTAKIAEEYAGNDKRIRLIINETNKGVAAARNTGILSAEGEYLAFLDSDDLWDKEKLDKQVRFMQERDAVISYTGTSYMNASGQLSLYSLCAEDMFTYEDLLRRNIMSCSSVMVQRNRMIPFAEGFMHEDMVVWLQVIKSAGPAHGLNEALLVYRMGVATKSSSRIKSAFMAYGSYRHIGYSRATSFIYMLRYAKHSISKRYLIKLGM